MIRTVLVASAVTIAALSATAALSRTGNVVAAEARGNTPAIEAAQGRYHTAGWFARRVVSR